jgi:hypothetical protein
VDLGCGFAGDRLQLRSAARDPGVVLSWVFGGSRIGASRAAQPKHRLIQITPSGRWSVSPQKARRQGGKARPVWGALHNAAAARMASHGKPSCCRFSHSRAAVLQLIILRLLLQANTAASGARLFLPSRRAPPPPPTREGKRPAWNDATGGMCAGRSGSGLCQPGAKTRFGSKTVALQGFARSQGQMRRGGILPFALSPFQGLPIAKDALRTQAPAIRQVLVRSQPRFRRWHSPFCSGWGWTEQNQDRGDV